MMLASASPVELVAELTLDSGIARALELVGIVAFAVSGGLAAVRHRFDIVGVVGLAIVTSVGGGAIRDVLIGAQPAAVVSDRLYLLLPIATAIVVMLFHRPVEQHLRRPVLVFDAAGVALFCVTGALKALDYGVTPIGAIFLGAVTATGGGVMRDLLCGERPAMFRADTVLYSIPAAAGAAIVVIGESTGHYTPVLGLGAALVVFLVRLAALRFGWRAPRPLD